MILAALLLLANGFGAALSAQQEAGAGLEDVIVVLDEGVDAEATARELGIKPKYVYDDVVNGFAARVPKRVAEAARRQRGVAKVERDTPIRAFAQTVPTGVRRIAADENATAAIDGGGGDLDVDIAVLDTGIARDRDLRIAGGTNCVGGSDWNDLNGHGTHMAGIAAARDDGRGVVGVAPGARLWAVKVLDDDGIGSVSSLVCGLDWVYAQRATIDVANLSIGGRGNEGDCAGTALHHAVCIVVNRGGIPVVAAAGNQGRDADRYMPGSYKEVITVSAFADRDGEPGGLGRPCRAQGDDVFLRSSNRGEDVDIAAPGNCIVSTWLRGKTRRKTGTSTAAAHVSGAIGLYLAQNPRASTGDVRKWLLSDAASRPQDSAEGFSGDPDGFPERVLYLGDSANAGN